ncbi:MAG: hypothetical protein RLZZ428_659 [Pseudomonadota bacterium]
MTFETPKNYLFSNHFLRTTSVEFPLYIFSRDAAVMELVDLVDSKSSAFGRVGSNPTCGTTNLKHKFQIVAGVAQWLEFLPSKQAVEGSNPFARSTPKITNS